MPGPDELKESSYWNLIGWQQTPSLVDESDTESDRNQYETHRNSTKSDIILYGFVGIRLTELLVDRGVSRAVEPPPFR